MAKKKLPTASGIGNSHAAAVVRTLKLLILPAKISFLPKTHFTERRAVADQLLMFHGKSTINVIQKVTNYVIIGVV